MKRILVVDPTTSLRTHIRSICTALGLASVDEVESGTEAWTLLVRDPGAYALVISEIRLPGNLDGIELLRTLRADPRGREIPFVILTAENHPSFAVAAGLGGATDYLLRPRGVDDLRERLRALATAENESTAA
ncbi:MAG: response regulator [Bdellovibrionales bacterium]|nr:response regulator [Bdellovibrionales bacterium]